MTDQLARVANEDLDEIPLGRGQPHLAGGSYRANGVSRWDAYRSPGGALGPIFVLSVGLMVASAGLLASAGVRGRRRLLRVTALKPASSHSFSWRRRSTASASTDRRARLRRCGSELPLREGDLRLNQVMIPVGSQGRSRWGIAGLRRGVGSVDALRHRGGQARAWSLG